MSGSKHPHAWQICSASYSRWIETTEAAYTASLVADSKVKFSIIMPVFDPDPDILDATLAAISTQTHKNWELCLADDGSTKPDVQERLEKATRSDNRILLKRLDHNVGIAGASNAALKLATGDFVLLVDHDDLIPAHALATVAQFIERYPNVRLFYSDSDHLDDSGNRCKPFFKPEWDYLRLLGQNYLNHLTVIETSLIRSIHGWREGFQGSQDYDLYLRISEVLDATRIKHIPHVLYHWRLVPNSAGRGQLAVAVANARKAINDHLNRVGLSGAVEAAGQAKIFNRILWATTTIKPKVLLVTYGKTQSQKDLNPQIYTNQFCELDHIFFDEDAMFFPSATLTSIANRGGYQALCVKAEGVDFEGEKDLSQALAVALSGRFGVIGARRIDSMGRLTGGPLFGSKRRVAEPYSLTQPEAVADSRGYVANLLLDQCVSHVSPKFFIVPAALLEKLPNSGPATQSINDWVHFVCSLGNSIDLKSVWLASVTLKEAPHKNGSGGQINSKNNQIEPEDNFIYPNSNFKNLIWEIQYK